MSVPARRRATGSFIVRAKNPRTTGKHPVLRRSWLQPTISLVAALLALSGCVVAMHYGWQALRLSTRLRLQRIDVVNAERASRDEVLQYTGLVRGQPILDVDLDAAALAARRHPWVKDALVRRRFPDTVVVEVVEHEPAIVVALDDLYLADVDGVPFKRLAPEDRVVSPVVTGLAQEGTNDPARVGKLVSDALAIQRALAHSAAAFGRLEEMHWDGDLGWSLVARPEGYGSGPVRIRLGQDPIQRVDSAEQALARLRQAGREAETLWADLSTPLRVHARLRNGRSAQGPNNSTLVAIARQR